MGDDDGAFDDQTPRAQRGASARTAKQATGVDAKRLFLYATPFAMLVLLGLGYYVSQLPPRTTTPKVLEHRYDDDVAKARAKYEQAKPLYTAAKALEGEAGLPKLREAEKLLHEANAIIDQVRDAIENDSKEPPGSQATPYFPHDDLQQSVNMLLVSCRKEIGARVR